MFSSKPGGRGAGSRGAKGSSSRARGVLPEVLSVWSRVEKELHWASLSTCLLAETRELALQCGPGACLCMQKLGLISWGAKAKARARC